MGGGEPDSTCVLRKVDAGVVGRRADQLTNQPANRPPGCNDWLERKQRTESQINVQWLAREKNGCIWKRRACEPAKSQS